MPPFLPRKRLASSPPQSPRTASLAKRARLTDTLDADHRHAPSLQDVRAFTLGEDDSDSSLSDLDSDEFEDIAPRTKEPGKHTEEHDEEEDIDWEDAIAEEKATNERHVPMANGDLQLTFSKENAQEDYGLAAAASGARKGPSRREKEVRLMTHRMHVQFLLYHNAIRNNWISDKTTQEILVKHLPAGVKKEVQKWRIASRLEVEPKQMQATPSSSKGKKRGKQKGEHERSQRDWGKPSQRMEKGKPDLSRGDPILPLMKVLSAYWKKRFAITAPGLRKRGYGTKIGLQQAIASYRKDPHDPERHGERISNLEEFRELARRCQGSRDVGAQLFTALLRGLGIESRLVASLQPAGFGFTKAEQQSPVKVTKRAESDSSEDEPEEETEKPPPSRPKAIKTPVKSLNRAPKSQGSNSIPIDLDASSEVEELSDDPSVVDVTSSMPTRKPTKFDKDLPYPIYWTEAVSPISHTVFPVSSLVLDNPVATTPETISSFEPRGAKAEKAKQVMAYVIAYSSDGTAKDVTTRYLRKRMWPGKTKGFRVAIEQVPIRNARGKIKRYEEYDWFKTAMSGYVRTDDMRTTVDDIEESSDLVPQQPEKKDGRDEGDTLQSLKSSADFVLERFLRREEALRPDAKPDRMFVSGKGDKVKEEPVYRRSDVERCLTTESWHKEGRRPRPGVVPLKQVAVRAVTLTRKREMLEEERQTGQKPTQGLYSRGQTEYIIPPPISDGVIPKNAYNNIDCFVPSMVPKGAVHIPLKGTVRICKKLGIDYAEAVTGFEFGNKMAIPVITGVVVAEENEEMVREAWETYAAEQKIKEDGKLEKAVLGLWRKFTMGLRINEKVQGAYGDDVDDARPEQNTPGQTGMNANAGGFATQDAEMAGGFFLPHEDDEHMGELVLEDHEPPPTHKHKEIAHYPTPVSMSSSKQRAKHKSPLPKESQETELSELSSTPEASRSSTVDGDEDNEKYEESFVPQSRKSTRASPAKKVPSSKASGKPRHGFRKSARVAVTSPYFLDEDDK